MTHRGNRPQADRLAKVDRHPWRPPAVLVFIAGLFVWGALGLPEAVEHDHPIHNAAGQVIGYHHGLSVAQAVTPQVLGEQPSLPA